METNHLVQSRHLQQTVSESKGLTALFMLIAKSGMSNITPWMWAFPTKLLCTFLIDFSEKW